MKVEQHLELSRRDIEQAFEFHVLGCSSINFIYNVNTKKIYEIINDRYKFVDHESIINQFKLDKANCYKFSIDTEFGRYETFKSYIGIKWLSLSDIYTALPARLLELKPLSKQDLDRIEKYCNNEVTQFVTKAVGLGSTYALEKEIELLENDRS